MNLTLLNIISASVVRRIALPRKLAGKMSRGESLRARMWTELSEHDQADVRQSVALALVAAGLPDKAAFRRIEEAEAKASATRSETLHARLCGGRADIEAADVAAEAAQARISKTARAALAFVPLSAWRAAFIAARRELRMGNRASDTEVSLNPLPVTGDESRLDLNNFQAPLCDSSEEVVRRARIARRVRYLRACIDASFAADLSRKRTAGRRGALRFLRWLTAYSAGRGFGRLEFSGRAGDSRRDQALADAKRRFVAYIARGEELLTASSLEGIPARKVREYRSLEALPALAFAE